MNKINFPQNIPVLESENIILKELTFEDRYDVCNIYLENQLCTSKPIDFLREDAQKIINSIKNSEKNEECIFWGALIRKTKKTAGIISVTSINKNKSTAFFNILTYKENYENTILFFPAGQILEFCFYVMNFNEIFLNPKEKKFALYLSENNNFIIKEKEKFFTVNKK
ncbi:MAG: hypothetical protein H7A30_07710 [Thermotogae bacterium]|nr:hypothetical protein [Thermotogota bacterium]